MWLNITTSEDTERPRSIEISASPIAPSTEALIFAGHELCIQAVLPELRPTL